MRATLLENTTELGSRQRRGGKGGGLPLNLMALPLAGLSIVSLLIWQGITASGNPNPLDAPVGSAAAMLDIGVLVFREGLECILVLAAVTAGMVGAQAKYRRPISAGVAAACVCTAITWHVAIGLMDNLTTKIAALTLQAATGLMAIVVLLIVMNWFFHKVYWAGWISLHTKRRQALVVEAKRGAPGQRSLWLGFALLGFTSFYREGFEVVLFLQSYRMNLGGRPVLYGVLIGMVLSGMVAVLTFVAHRQLPYRKMLVLTGIMLGGVLLVMVGEQAQEMQIAYWLPETDLPALARIVPPWAGVWFSIFPTVETLAAQFIAATLVLGSYFAARSKVLRRPK
jgi:high-affinity iron transporter